MRNQKLIVVLVMAALLVASCGGNDEPTPTPVPPPTFTPTVAPTITPAPTATPEPPTAAPTLAPTEPPPAAAPTQDAAVAQPEAPVSPLEAPVEAPVSPLPTPDASSVLTPPQPIAGLWQLVAFTDTAGIPGAIPPGGLRLQLSSTGEVGVATACERARGSYLSSPLNGVAFTIDPIGNRCAPGSNVETLITSLVSTNGYRVPPGGLVFTSNAGPLQYDFVPVIPMGDALSWPRLQSLTYFVPDAPGGNNQAALVNGEFRAKASPEATTEFVVSLAPVHAFGEFDNDASATEAVVVLVVEPGDGSSSYYLVPVFNAGMFPVALQPTLLGQNLTVRNISIADGKIVVETDSLGAGPGACCPQAGRRQTFTLAGDRLAPAGDEALPAATIRTRRNRLVQDVAMAPGATSLVVNGEINFNDTQPFRIRAAAGQIMTATLQTPNDDVWLSIFGENDRFVLNSINAASRTWSGPLPATQDYIINLAAVGSTTPYTLALEITGDGAAIAQMPAPAPNTRLGEIQLPGATTDKVIYLTVQSGPNAASTTALLDALARNGAQADFFMDANAIAANPALVDAIFAAGHGIAPAAPIGAAQSGPARDAYFQGVGAARTALAGRNTACLQLPYGEADAFTRAYAAELGYEVMLWDIDARDWAQPGAEAIASAITTQAFPGAVVRLNDMGDPTQTAAALDQALPALTQQGYSVRAYCVPVMSMN